MEFDIAAIIKSRRDELDLSQDALAEMVGTSQTTIEKIENRKTLNSRFLPKIFGALGLPLDMLVSSEKRVGVDYALVDGKQRLLAIEAKSVPGDQLVGEKDLPIYSAVRAGSFTDSVLVSPDAIDYVRRPEPLQRARNGYGLYVMGDSMEPAYRQGDLALIHPNLPPKAGDEVVVCSVDADGEFYALIKQLVRATADKWYLRQYNPGPGEEREFTLDRREWPVCHLVVGNYRRR
jgi:phage repressor protein C with HTH and peptisase S24 domain